MNYYMNEDKSVRLYNGDCLDVMDEMIKKEVKVDAIIADIPYGTTKCKWDTVIPFDKMWERLNKLIKPNGAVVLFGKQPFTSVLNCSNIKNYKQEIIWKKDNVDNPMQAKKRFLNTIENISVFYKKPPTYNPQGTIDCVVSKKQDSGILINAKGVDKSKKYTQRKTNYPKNILSFSIERAKDRKHPTQKPVPLMEYLIKTYTNENEVVLDFTMGSGSTGVACKNTNRDFIGIELDEKYFEVAKQRILGDD